MNGLATIPEIITHTRGEFPHLIFLGRDYSIADLILDLEQIERVRKGLERDSEQLTRLIEKRTPVAELSDQETVERLRSHVRRRSTPALENGAWMLMLHAADRLEFYNTDRFAYLVGD